MPLDPAIKDYLANVKAQKNQPYSSYTPTALRKAYYEKFKAKSKSAPIEVAEVKEFYLDNNGRKIKCRAYYPMTKQTKALPALMYFHGGGFVIRDHMDLYDQTCRMIAVGVACVVVAVDFSLAPEHPFPAAPEDCYFATCWVAAHEIELRINADRLGVWGESCGGNLATVVAMMARDRAGPKLCCQVIVTAMLDYNFETDSYRDNGSGDYFLTEDSMKWFWNHYLSEPSDSMNPYCVPLQAANLSQLPKALVITVEYDPLRDEGVHYAKALQKAGVEVQATCYSGLVHGFFDLYALSSAADTACREIIERARSYLNE